MKKELIFNEMIDNILSCVTIARFEKAELIPYYDQILIPLENGRKEYFCSVPDEIEGESIHGNTRNTLAKEFIQLYSFEYLKGLYNKKVDEYNKNIQLQNQNKYKLDDLYTKINFLNKYGSYNHNNEVRFFHGVNKFCIEFNCSKNEYNYDNIKIYLSPDFKNFEFKYDYESKIFTENQVIEAVNNLAVEYEEYLNKKNLIEENKRIEREKENNLRNKIKDLYISDDKIILKKGKKTFICFHNGTRYSIGTGKSGKFYNCNFQQFYELIVKKNMKEYYILDKDLKTYMFSDEELNNLSYTAL